jgi:hypothetical protein
MVRNIQKMKIVEMCMLRWMCGHTRKENIRNEIILEKMEVASIQVKMKENRLRWFEHIQRRLGMPLFGELSDGNVMCWVEVKVNLRRYRKW